MLKSGLFLSGFIRVSTAWDDRWFHNESRFSGRTGLPAKKVSWQTRITDTNTENKLSVGWSDVRRAFERWVSG
jgi:hypothetical protein